MTNGSSPHGALDAVRRLESALEAGDHARVAADDALGAARAEAAHLLADAWAEGAGEGRRRRAELLEAAKSDAAAIRAAGDAEAEELLRLVSAERDQLVSELTAVVLGREA
jgi:hypothetical protein